MSIEKTNFTTFPTQSSYYESGKNNKFKQSLPNYNEAINSSEFNDILRNNRYLRIQYLVPTISYVNERPAIFTSLQYQDIEIECQKNRNKRIKSIFFGISVLLIVMIPAVFILLIIVTNITTK